MRRFSRREFLAVGLGAAASRLILISLTSGALNFVRSWSNARVDPCGYGALPQTDVQAAAAL